MMVGAIGSFGVSTSVMWYQMSRSASISRASASRPSSAAERDGRAEKAARSTVGDGVSGASVKERFDAPSAAAAQPRVPYGPSELPYVPNGYSPEELANRTRVRAMDEGDLDRLFDEAWNSIFPNREQDGTDDKTGGALFSTDKEDKYPVLPGEDSADEDEQGRYTEFGTPLSNALEGKRKGLENEIDQEKIPGIDDPESPSEVMENSKCETCAKRKYQDGSNDPGVSFKTPQHVAPQLAQSAVRGHEMEHVVRERVKAQQENRKVISQSVTYHMGICPECGKFYVSGGTTRTVTAADNTKEDLSDRAERVRLQMGLDL